MYKFQTPYFAFNIWDMDSIQAVIDAAAECRHDVILQTSSRIFADMDHQLIRGYVDTYSRKAGINAYLHLDHCHELDRVKAAVDAGWDSVMLDASHLPLEENIALTNEVCSCAHPRGVLVEAEVGQIHGVEEEIAVGEESIASLEDVRRFLAETDTDLIAAAVGTSHGLYRKEPEIQYGLISAIQKITDKPFVVHGGSGLAEAELKKLLSCPNVKKINISTDLKQAYRVGVWNAAGKGMLEKDGFDVLKVKKEIYESIRLTAMQKIALL